MGEVSDKEKARRQRLIDFWRSPEGRARRSELSRRPEHLAKLRQARDGRTPEQIDQTAEALRRWNASPEGQAQTKANLKRMHAEWAPSAENLAHLSRLHDSWARSPEGIAQASANRRGLQEYVRPLRTRDGGLCQLCLSPIDFRLKRSPLSVSVDHIVPARAGGADELRNLWLAHLVCNMRKGARYAGRVDGSVDPRRIA